jgi:hypothetical protein
MSEVEQKNDPISISDTFADTRWSAEWWSAGAANDLLPDAAEAVLGKAEQKRQPTAAIPLRQGLPRRATTPNPGRGFPSYMTR